MRWRPLASLQNKVGVGAEGPAKDTDAVVLHKSNGEDDNLDGIDLGEMEVLLLVEEHDADATLGAGDAFHHGQHHPAYGCVLSEDLERLVEGAENNDLPNDAPLLHAESAGVVEFGFRDGGDDGGHARDVKDGHAEDEEGELDLGGGG